MLLRKKRKKISFKDEINFKLAESYFLEGKYEDAMFYLEEFIEQYPRSVFIVAAYNSLAHVYQKMGEFDKANEYFSKIKTEYPISFEARKLLKTDKPEIRTFGVQVGAFFDKDNAYRRMAELREKKYDATVIRSEKNNSTYYLVRLGSFKKKREADVFAKKLAKEGFQTLVYP